MIKRKLSRYFKKMSIVFLALTMLMSLIQWSALNTVKAKGAIANITFKSQIVEKVGDTSSTMTNVESGRSFFLALGYNVNSGGDNVNYKSCLISIQLPKYIEFEELVIPDGSRSVFNSAEIIKIAGHDMLRISSSDTLEAGNAGTIYLKMHFKNMETPDGTTAIFNNMEMTGSEQSGNNSTDLEPVVIPSTKITSSAHQEWTIQKSIEKQDGQNTSVVEINNKKFYKVNYEITIKPGGENVDANRYGRLNCSPFILKDDLPDNYPDGGEPQISGIKVGNKTLQEGTDYVLEYNKTDKTKVEGIQLNYVNTYNGSDSQSFIPKGAAINTTYSITVLYDYNAYKFQQNEEFNPKTLTNAATLTYQPLGENEQTVSSSIPVVLGWQEENGAHTNFKVTKKATVKTTGTPSIHEEETKVFDKSMQDIYYRSNEDPIQFGLYTDEKCQTLAKDMNKKPINPITLDENGEVLFKDVLYGTYYLKEVSGPKLFTKNQVKKIVIDADDASITVDDQKISGTNIDFINTTDQNGYGYVAFWKRGSSATSKDTGWLSGVQFTLTSTQNKLETYTATSDKNGIVLFEGIPAGEYTVKENATIDGEFEISDKTWNVTVKGNQVNYPEGMDIYKENNIDYPYVKNVSNKGKLKFIKSSSLDNSLLKGAQFEIFVPDDLTKTYTEEELKNFDTSGLESYVLDSKDQTFVESPALVPGTYVYREIKAPEGYTLDSQFKSVKVEQNTLVDVDVKNVPQGCLEIKKYGILSAELPFTIPLAGAEFQLYTSKESTDDQYLVKDSQGNPIVIKSTVNNTEPTSNIVYLDEGTYYLRETKAPDHYIKLTDPIEVKITSGIEEGVTVQNTINQHGLVKIHKTDKKTSVDLADAVFDIKDATGKVVDTITTNSQGNAESVLLPSGTYTLVEKKAPNGYTTLNKEISFTISDNEITTINDQDIANIPYMKYQFTKISSQKRLEDNSDIKISGVTFRLYDEDPNQNPDASYREFTSDNNGLVTFDKLINGQTYYFVESETDLNYTLDSKVHSFVASIENATLQSGSWVQVGQNVENVPKGKFTVHKTITEFDSTNNSNLKGVNFYYYPLLTNDANQDKETAKRNKTYMSLGTTPGSGELQSGLLDAGKYWVEEEKKDKYNEISPQIVEVKPGITINANAENGLLEINNTYAVGRLKIKKISLIDSKGIDASFYVYKKDGNKTDYSNDTKIWEVRTNGNPVGVKLSTHLFEPGEYVLVEQKIHSGSYILDKTPYPFTIEAGKTNTVYFDKPIVNVPTSSLSLIKYESWNSVGQDEVNFVSAGFQFKIYYAVECSASDVGAISLNGKYYQKGEDTNKTLTSGTQEVSVSGMNPGVYIIEEVLTNQQIKDGYQKATPQAVELVAGGNAKVTFKNKNSNSKIKVIKVDAADHDTLLDDAVFEIYRLANKGENGEEITIGNEKFNVISAGLHYQIKSGTAIVYDKDGKAIASQGIGFSGFLTPGETYFLKEVQAPHGYVASQIWTKVGPLKSGELSEVTIENFKPIEAVGSKVDGLGHKVAGATFALFSSKVSAETVAKLSDSELAAIATDANLQKQYGILQVTITGSDGQIKFKSLDTTQTYYVLEIKAPVESNNPAYQRDSEVHEVKIKVDGHKYYLIDQKTNKTLSVVNYKYQRIWLKKQLEFAGEKTELNGVDFEIYKAVPTNNSSDAVISQNGQYYSLGDKVDTLHTGTDTSVGNGGAVSIGLPSGVYIIKELDSLPDKGLIVNDSNRYHIVTLTTIDETNNEDNKVLFDNPIINNTKYGSFYLNKISNINDQKLKATFVLEKETSNGTWESYHINGKTVEIKTDGQNVLEFDKAFNVLLPAGQYRLVEKEVEPGYTKGNPITFEIKENKITGMNNQTVEYYDLASDAINHPLVVVNNAQGYVHLNKLGRQISDSNRVENKVLDGIQFEIYKYKVNNGKLDLSEKVGTAISQSNSQIYFYDLSGKNVTDINWLDAGDYVIKETDVGIHTSEGYVAEYLGKFTITSNQMTTTVVEVNDKGEAIGTEGNSIINQSHYGKFSVKKIDKYNENKSLESVQFELYTKSGTSYQKVDKAVITTDRNGIATSPLLPEGDYYLKEIKTLDGYVLSDEYFGPYSVTQQTVNQSLTPITNVMKQSIQIKKIDSKTDIEIADLTGTTFALYKNESDAEPLQTVTYQEGIGILFTDLDADTTYYIKETKAPVGYELDSKLIPVKTSQTQDDSAKPVVKVIEVENNLLGSLRVEKVAQWDLPNNNSQKLPLAGVEFSLYKNNGITLVQKGITDKEGVLTFVGLVQGDYILKETKTIEGFASNEVEYNINIVKGEENKEYTGDKAIVNYPTLGKFEFKKIKADGNGLPGAHFKLIRLEGQKETVVMEDFTTDNEGFFASAMLEPGNYRLVETQAPSGYAKIDPINFEIVEKQITKLGNNGQIIDHAQGKITIIKYNDVHGYLSNDNEVLEGVHFGLYTNGNQLVEEKITDKNGKIVWENINPGEYYVQEILTDQNPEGYQYSDQKYEVTIENNKSIIENYYPNETQTGAIINHSTMGKLVIKKNDANNPHLTKELAGAVFGIYSDSQYTHEVSQITIGDDGYGISDLLLADKDGTTYYVKELKAPKDYVLDDSLYKITGDVKVYPIQNEELIKADVNKNYIKFENISHKDLMNFKTEIQKGITTSMKTSVIAEDSLSEKDYQTTFALRGYANGNNTVPAEYLEVSDTKTTMLYYDASKGQYVKDDKIGEESWIINSVNIYRAYNQGNIGMINAQLYYQSYNNGQLSDWKEVPNGEITDVQNIGTTSYRTISLSPELKAVHVKVKYTGITKEFYANGIDINMTFNQRPSSVEHHEIRLIKNVADVDYGFIVKDNEGKEILQKVTPVSNEVQITFPTLESKMPTVNIGVIPSDPTGNGKTTYKPGDTVQYDITVKNVSENNEIFKQPIISFDMPIGMSINDKFDPNQNGRYRLIKTNANGIMDTIDLNKLLITYTPVQNARVIDQNGLLTETDNPTTKVTFKFGNLDFALQAGESLKLTLAGTIAANEALTSLWMPTYLNSEEKIIQSAENPYGNSFSVNVPGNISNPLVEDKVLDKVLNSSVIGGNKFANANANIAVNENNSLTINKYVKGDYDSKYLDYNQIGSTSPGGSIDYMIEAKNGEESDSAVNKIRIVDVLPFAGDSYVGRDNEGGTLTRRVTELKRDAILKSVDVSQSPAGSTYKIYYCVDGSDEATKWEKWLDNDITGRMSTDKETELPMLYDSMADSVWDANNNYHHWIEATNSDNFDSDLLPYVSAIAVEITCGNGNYLKKGESVQMHISMTAPMYTTSEVDQFRDKLIANSAMVAVGRVGHQDTIANSDRTENHEVKVQLTMPTGSIGDYAFYDINRDGFQDENDAPIAGLKVTLHQLKSYYKGNKIVLEETLYDTETDNNGYYHFGDLACNVPIKDENVDSNDPNDFVGKVLYEYYVEFAEPKDESRYRYQPTIQYAKDDQDKAHPEIDSNINNELKTETVRLTAKRGNDGLTYTGEDNPTLDAGFSALGALGDYVWFDANRNGIQDENETGINGVTVHLYEASQDGTVLRKVDSQVTRNVYGKDGYYLFEELQAGYYVVEFDISKVNPEAGGYSQHYTFTTAYQGDGDFDSNASVKISDTMMRSEVITLPERGYDMSIDAGLVVYSAITGIAFEDRNYSNIQDLDGKTDVYIPGTIVELYEINSDDGSRSDKPIATQTVGEDGRYYFDHLIEGNYQVKFTFPNDYEIINANIGDDTLDSDVEYDINEELTSGYTDIISIPQNRLVEHVDGGASRYSSLGDYVWFDANKNGLQDNNSDEYGIENVPVYLQMRSSTTNGWEQVAESITNSDGYYRFDHLKSSDYHTGIEYRILFDLPFNSKLTIPKNGDPAKDSNALVAYVPGSGYPTDIIHLKYNSVDLTWDAGIVNSLGSVGDYVWVDENKNGIQDEVNTGLSGISVILEYNESGDMSFEGNWTVIGTTTTNDSGYYVFNDLVAGMYRVRFQIDKPYYVTLSHMGKDNALDSDGISLFDDNWYYTRPFYLEEEGYDMTWDCGVYLPDTEESIITFIPGFPMTGDQTFIYGYLALACLSAGGLVAATRYQRKRKRKVEKQ